MTNIINHATTLCKGISGGIFNAYCWTHATFTLPLVSRDGREMIHPGVGAMHGQGDDNRVYHGWYQWVGMALFGQAFTFYIGHFLWKSCEGRRVERLVSGNTTTFEATSQRVFIKALCLRQPVKM